MAKGLHAILGTSNRVRKPSSSPSKRRATTPSSPSPRKKTTTGRRKPLSQDDRDQDADYFQDKLDDGGFARLLEEDLTLRDVVQAMKYIRSHMFTPVPETGFNSTRMSELRSYRASMPPLVTIGHISAILRNNPTRVEREIVELQQKGVLRRVRIERRGGQGEALIETSDLEKLLEESVKPTTKDKLAAYLRENPTAQTVPSSDLTDKEADELIRAGFLTSFTHRMPGDTLNLRPEDRTTLMSLDRVSRSASGTLSAVGGANAIHLSGGGSGALSLSHASSPSPLYDLKLAIPGHGRYMKLAEACVEWVRESMGRTKWGECPESWLKERFGGGGLYGPRWKEFWGVEWQFALGEAVGLGKVELFNTGSVGRGVRALG